MIAICHACAIDIVDSSVPCNGFCKAEFHLKCCNIASEIAEELIKNKQLFWMCQSCTKLMEDIRFRNSIHAAFESGQEKVLSSHNEIVESLKSEILVELKNEIRSNFTALINSSSHTPKSSARPLTAVGSLRSRRLFRKPAEIETHQQNLLIGTGNSLSPSLGTFTVPLPKQKFWLYLSRISRDVSVEQVRNLVAQRLGTEDVQVFRLVANGKNVNELSFISFKIGLSPDFKAKALETATWPKGILFREFKDNTGVQNFWKPHQTPNNNHAVNAETRRSELVQDTAMLQEST